MFGNKCKHDSDFTTNKYCQKSCFDNGAGYDGDDCSTPAPTNASTEAPTTSAPTHYWGDPDNNCRHPSIPAAPIYIEKYAGFRCSGGTSHADAGNKQACAEAAVAANHTFISFNSTVCESTTACDTRTDADGWNVHKRWLGAFNATHADEVPACDGPVESGEYYSNRCATQVTVNGTRNDWTCTSCKPGKSFYMMKGASRTGKCGLYLTHALVECSVPNSDVLFDPSTANARICTKQVETQLYFQVEHMEDEGAKAHYASVMGGLWGLAIPRCTVRKETACGADGNCDVQKTVQCLEVCKLTEKKRCHGSTYNSLSDCSAALCDGEYGELACKGAAMME